MTDWQDITTAPARGRILLWIPPSDLLAGVEEGHIEIDHRQDDGRATHWMPLPEPPATPP